MDETLLKPSGLYALYSKVKFVLNSVIGISSIGTRRSVIRAFLALTVTGSDLPILLTIVSWFLLELLSSVLFFVCLIVISSVLEGIRILWGRNFDWIEDCDDEGSKISDFDSFWVRFKIWVEWIDSSYFCPEFERCEVDWASLSEEKFSSRLVVEFWLWYP